jgi:uncharacterized protein YdhG (YjbR/CyaY superfamily)
MRIEANTIAEYLDQIPPERKQAISTLRQLIHETVPDVEESLGYNMPTYNAAGDFLAAIASQKNYMSLYMDSEVVAAHKDDLAGLNCGKSCIRFRRLEQLPLDVVRTMLLETVARRQQSGNPGE